MGHFCSKQCGLTIKEGFPGNVIMHEAAQARTQVNKTIPVVLPSSMPSLCASSGAVSAFVMLLLLRMLWDSLFESAHVHRRADVAGDACGRSQLRPGPMARAHARPGPMARAPGPGPWPGPKARAHPIKKYIR